MHADTGDRILIRGKTVETPLMATRDPGSTVFVGGLALIVTVVIVSAVGWQLALARN
jgi:hypothetical protein